MSFWQDISKSRRPLFLPDIGTYFNQDMAQAEALVDALAEAGVTTIKGEILQNANVCLAADDSGNEKYWGHKDNKPVEENYRALIERKLVPLDAYRELFHYVKSKGMQIVVSVYDFEGADFAKQIGVVAIKIASSNITHQPLVEYVARLGLPMIFDTGHSTMEEAARAVNWAHDQGADDILVEHSPPGPPNGPEKQNLRFMQTLGLGLKLPYGLSDHFSGAEMLYAATALGATVLEKGVCPDEMGNEQDGGHALPISRVSEVYQTLCHIADGLGDGVRHLPRGREKYISRMGLIAKRDLVAGDELNLESVDFAFPAKGVRAEYWSEVEGHDLKNPIPAGQVIKWSDILFND